MPHSTSSWPPASCTSARRRARACGSCCRGGAGARRSRGRSALESRRCEAGPRSVTRDGGAGGRGGGGGGRGGGGGGGGGAGGRRGGGGGGAAGGALGGGGGGGWTDAADPGARRGGGGGPPASPHGSLGSRS